MAYRRNASLRDLLVHSTLPHENSNEARKITDSISCHSKNLIYLTECKRCHLQYIGETKRQLSERFGKHRRSILNHQQLSTTTPASLHFNQADHPINDVRLIPIELILSKKSSRGSSNKQSQNITSVWHKLKR